MPVSNDEPRFLLPVPFCLFLVFGYHKLFKQDDTGGRAESYEKFKRSRGKAK